MFLSGPKTSSLHEQRRFILVDGIGKMVSSGHGMFQVYLWSRSLPKFASRLPSMHQIATENRSMRR